MIQNSMKNERSFTRLSLILSGFSLNGELLMDALGGETSFADVTADGVGFVPACTIGVSFHFISNLPQ